MKATAASSLRVSVSPECGPEVRKGERIEHVARFQPRPSSNDDAPAQGLKALTRVCIARNDDPRAPLVCQTSVDVVHVQAMRLRVDLERDAAGNGAIDDGVDVDRIRLSRQQPAPGGMTKDIDVWIRDGSQEPVRHLLPVLIEC